MTIDEIIEHCRQHNTERSFRALPDQGFATDVTFTVFDAHYQFISYTGIEGQFVTVNDLKEIGMSTTRFEWVD